MYNVNTTLIMGLCLYFSFYQKQQYFNGLILKCCNIIKGSKGLRPGCFTSNPTSCLWPSQTVENAPRFWVPDLIWKTSRKLLAPSFPVVQVAVTSAKGVQSYSGWKISFGLPVSACLSFSLSVSLPIFFLSLSLSFTF